MRCKACRRPITSPVSKQYGLGPDCLRKAVKAGTAPIEALTELTAWQRSKPRSSRPIAAPPQAVESTTPDLFSNLRDQAIAVLNAAAADCRAVGITVTIEIK